MLKLIPKQDNDTAGLGTACHEGFRQVLKNGADLATATLLAVDEWSSLFYATSTNITEIATEAEGIAMVVSVMERWWNEIYLPEFAKARILEVEQPFTVLVYQDDNRCIYLQGTYDLRVPKRAVDWKSANKAYSGRDAWKYQRSYLSVQHIVYCWAIDVMLGLDPLAQDDGNQELSHSFTYYVIPREPKGTTVPNVDKLEVRPTVNDCAFLLEELFGWAYLIEAELPQWPLGPTDWWCSPKWCPAWEQCRGLHHGPDPWGLVQKMNDNLKKKGYQR